MGSTSRSVHLPWPARTITTRWLRDAIRDDPDTGFWGYRLRCADCGHQWAAHVRGPDRVRFSTGWPIYDATWRDASGGCAHITSRGITHEPTYCPCRRCTEIQETDEAYWPIPGAI